MGPVQAQQPAPSQAEAGTNKGFLISFLGSVHLLLWGGLADSPSPCLGPLALCAPLITQGLPASSPGLLPEPVP